MCVLRRSSTTATFRVRSIPLFSNEKSQVGTRYKQVSKDSAILLGLEIVGPKLADFAKKSRRVAPDGKCWYTAGAVVCAAVFAWLLETTGMKVATLQRIQGLPAGSAPNV